MTTQYQDWREDNRKKLEASDVDPLYLRALVEDWLRLKQQSDSDIVRTQTTPADAGHSSLLLRLFSGKDALDRPPPRSFSYPWYDLMEKGHAESVEVWFGKPDDAIYAEIVINQSMQWVIEERFGAGDYLVRCPPNRDLFHLQRHEKAETIFQWSLERV